MLIRCGAYGALQGLEGGQGGVVQAGVAVGGLEAGQGLGQHLAAALAVGQAGVGRSDGDRLDPVPVAGHVAGEQPGAEVGLGEQASPPAAILTMSILVLPPVPGTPPSWTRRRRRRPARCCACGPRSSSRPPPPPWGRRGQDPARLVGEQAVGLVELRAGAALGAPELRLPGSGPGSTRCAGSRGTWRRRCWRRRPRGRAAPPRVRSASRVPSWGTRRPGTLGLSRSPAVSSRPLALPRL